MLTQLLGHLPPTLQPKGTNPPLWNPEFRLPKVRKVRRLRPRRLWALPLSLSEEAGNQDHRLLPPNHYQKTENIPTDAYAAYRTLSEAKNGHGSGNPNP